MSIESLVGLHAPEIAIQDELVLEIQSHFEFYKSKCFFIKLDRISAGVSKVGWVKEFDSVEALDEFYDDSVYERACIMVKFSVDHYKVLVQGFHWSNLFELHSDHIANERPQAVTENRETRKMLPKELLQAGVLELKQMLHSGSSRRR